MAAPAVTEVILTRADLASPRFTPRELRLVTEYTGRSFSQVMSDEDSDDKYVVFAWLKARRDGHPDLAWSAMDDVVITMAISDDAPADPTNGRPGITSPPSVATGA